MANSLKLDPSDVRPMGFDDPANDMFTCVDGEVSTRKNATPAFVAPTVPRPNMTTSAGIEFTV